MRRQGNYSLFGAIVLCVSVAVSWAADDSPPAGALQAAIESPAALEGKPVSPPDARGAGSYVAVIDLGKVYMECEDFKKLQIELKKDVDRASEKLKAQRAALQTRQAKLAALSPADPDYNPLAEQVTTESAQLQSQFARQKLAFTNREAKMYRDTFLRCKQAIGQWATAHNVALVLQVSASDDDESPEAIKREMAKQVLYHHGIEITSEIIRSMNESSDSVTAEKPSVEGGKTAVTYNAPAIATVDLQRVFSVDAAFRRESEELQADVKEAEKTLVAEKARLAAHEEALQQLDKNGDEYRRELARLVEQQAAFTVLLNRQKGTLSRREADVYLARYREIQRTLTHLAEARGLAIVLQVNNGALSDDATPEETKAALGKFTLYHRGVDVTDHIVGALDKAEGSTSARQPTAVPNSTAADDSRTQVATLDLSRAISENASFKRATAQLKADAADAEKGFAAQKQQLQQDSEKLQQLKQGSEDYRRKEEKIAEQAAAVREKVSRQKRDFVYRDWATYLAAYREIESAIAELAAEKGLRLVLQFHDEPSVGDDANRVQAELRKIVLYQHGIDVTDDVIERVASRANDAR